MRSRYVLIFLLGFLSVWTPIQAEDKPEDPEPPEAGVSAVPFNFAPPGARALSMGGTFIGIADDATASESNPAGLTILTRPEVSVHYRDTSFNVETFDANAQRALDFIFVLPDSPPSPIGVFDESVSDISFASFVKPFEKWAFSIYYQQSANFEGATSFALTDEVFQDFYTTENRLDLLLENVGVSAAFNLGKMVSVGISLRQSSLEFNRVRELRTDFFGDLEFLSGNFNHLDFFGDRTVEAGDDDDVTFNVGLLVNPNGKFSFGLVYKEGGDFDIPTQREVFDCIDFPPFLTCDPNTQQGNRAFFETTPLPDTRIMIPDFLGLGVAWRPTQRLTIAADVNEITYSDLEPRPEDFIEGVSEPVDDEVEFHFGLEYTVLAKSNKVVSLRAGFWTDPDHDGIAVIDSDQTHVTAGVGFVLKDLQIDIAGHFSDTVDEGLLSFVYRF